MIPPRLIYHCRRHQPRLMYGSLARYSLPASAHGDITNEMRLEDRSSKATSGRGRQRRDSPHETRCTCKPRPWPRQRAARPSHRQHCSSPRDTTIRACDCENDYNSSTCARARARFSASPCRGPVANNPIYHQDQGLPVSPHFITATPPPTLLAPIRIRGRLRSDLASP